MRRDHHQQLGLQYLWINSTCIEQDKDGDVEQEVQKMEDVFSSAYGIFAASRTAKRGDLLSPWRKRKHLNMAKPGQLGLYVC